MHGQRRSPLRNRLPQFALPPEQPLPSRKACSSTCCRRRLSIADRFKMARDVGFEVVQAPTTPDRAAGRRDQERRRQREHSHRLRDEHGLTGNTRCPRAILRQWRRALLECGLRCTTPSSGVRMSVLLVPAVVNPQTSYRDAWSRSQKGNSQADSARGRTESRYRHRRSLEQVPAEPSGDGHVYR